MMTEKYVALSPRRIEVTCIQDVENPHGTPVHSHYFLEGRVYTGTMYPGGDVVVRNEQHVHHTIAHRIIGRMHEEDAWIHKNFKVSKLDYEEVICRLCGSCTQARYVMETRRCMVEQKLCFNCHYWQLRVEMRDNPRMIRVDGTVYVVGKESPKERSAFRGFGGAPFYILRHGENVPFKTTNLWHNGKIPEHFKSLLPDNASFWTREEFEEYMQHQENSA